jgi:hypothetical protein
MSEPSNGQAISLPQHNQPLPNGHQARYTAETVLRTRPKTYRKIVHLLTDPYWSALQISKTCRVSEHTVRAIRRREAQDIAERKKSLAAMLANVAELGAGRMEETVGKAGCRDAAIVTGIATDKMLALTGQTPVGIQIANIQIPTPEQDEARRRAHHALDEITRLLHKQEPLSEKEELMLKVQCRVLKITHDVDHPRSEKCSQSREDIR